MATFKDIQAANKSITTMTITRWDKKQQKEISKDYAEVNQRIKAFRMVYPDGFIITDMIDNTDGVCVFTAKVGFYDASGDARIVGTGTAFEDKKASLINGTSYIENCETSAVGRALGMAGFGIDTSVASAEEVKNAMAQQDAAKSGAQMPQNAPAPVIEQFACCVCNGVFTDKRTANATFKKFGKYVCPDCVKKKTEEAKKKKSEETAAKLKELADANQLPFEIV